MWRVFGRKRKFGLRKILNLYLSRESKLEMVKKSTMYKPPIFVNVAWAPQIVVEICFKLHTSTSI